MKRWKVSGTCLTCGGTHERETDNPDQWLNAETGTVGSPDSKGIVWIQVNNDIHGCRFTRKEVNNG